MAEDKSGTTLRRTRRERPSLGVDPRIVLVVALSAGCGAETVVGEAWLWRGHRCHWGLLSHRVAAYQSTVEDGDVTMVLRGGPWATGETFVDEPLCSVAWSRITAPGLRVHTAQHGIVASAEGPVEVDVEVALPGGPPEEGEVVVAVPLGLQFDTADARGSDWDFSYEPADGFTPKGWGSGVRLLSVDGERATVRLTAQYEPGPLDREDMNEAAPHSLVPVTVRYGVWVLPGGAAEEATVAGQSYTVVDPPFTEFPDWPVADRTATFTETDALTLLWPNQWSFGLSAQLDGTGRYLRAWRAAVDPPVEGASDVVADLFLSISSAFEEGDLDVAWGAGITRLTLPADATVEHGLAEAVLPPEGVLVGVD